MKIFLERVLFVNRAPFDRLELDFSENEIAVLTAVNGKGKTTILSHIVDAFYEMARPYFQDFENKENKYYRVSSTIFNLDFSQPSFVYLRFRTIEGDIDYIDLRNTCTEEQYNKAITLEDKIPFSEIKKELENSKNIKKLSSRFNKEKAEKLFYNNLITYFPSYRYETPGYLNDPYKIKLDFKKESSFDNYLRNPIEVITGLSHLVNWIMDIILDLQYPNLNTQILIQNLSIIITNTLISKKYGPLRFGVGPRGLGSTRIQIVSNPDGPTIYPSIFNLSSGESAILCLFGELLRQADNIKNNTQLDEITGIVLIDEVEKHLHIKLQKEVLPMLLNLFPNVQFIVSSHSPFFSMGLADQVVERSKIIDLDKFGISKDPTTNEQYKDVYNMMINENERFKDMYLSIKQKVQEGTTPLIITEGKTDIKHLKKAKEKLNINDCELDFFLPPDGEWGESELKTLLENLSKVRQPRKIIGIFDRDVPKTISDIEKDGGSFKNYGNNVYALCIPKPLGRESYTNISIEFYYTDEELKKEKDGKRLYFDNEVEFRQSASKKQQRTLTKLDSIKADEEISKKIFDENIGGLSWVHSKAIFADLIENDESFTNSFDFSNFKLIFNKIKEIIDIQ